MFENINDASNYVIRLGKNRIAMLNTKYDVGIIDDDAEGAALRFGYATEDEDQFATGSPNSIGIAQDDVIGILSDPLQILQKALSETAETKGLVIVGLHAPPFNISGNENAFYFRETQHDTAEWQEVLGFLVRQGDPYSFRDAQGSFNIDAGLSRYPGWVKKREPLTTDYFKSGDLDTLLKFSVSEGRVVEFLKLCLGQGSPQPVDLVLCGHLHYAVEFRLAWDRARNFLFFTDFYTENPSEYYSTRIRGVDGIPEYTASDGWAYVGHLRDKMRNVYVEVKDNPQLTDPTYNKWENGVDPYWRTEILANETPLNKASDSREWWRQNRPLILQTGGIGPLDTYQRPTYKQNSTEPTKRNATFQGFRVVLVRTIRSHESITCV